MGAGKALFARDPETTERACLLTRRPRLQLRDAQGAIPFVVGYHRRCVWFCGRPRPVSPGTPLVLQPRRSAFFAFDKYRCDVQTKREAAIIQITLDKPLRVRLPDYPGIGWCGKGVYGSRIELSPYEMSADAATQRG